MPLTANSIDSSMNEGYNNKNISRTIFNHAKNTSTLIPTIDTILSMDDTVLRSIDISIDHKVLPLMSDEEKDAMIIHERKHIQSRFSENHPCSTSKGANYGTNWAKSMETVKDNEQVSENTLRNVEEVTWQEDTFLNQAFTQLNSSHDLETVSGQDSLDTCLGKVNEANDALMLPTLKLTQKVMKNTITPEEEDAWDEISIDSIKLSINSPKDINMLGDIVPKKKQCVDTYDLSLPYTTAHKWSQEKQYSFYGLPSTVEQLYRRIRGIENLHRWQDECLKSEAVQNRKNLICALPTSGGKTLIAEILMLKEIVCNKKNAIFILPFIAIVQEKVTAMTPLALELDFLVEEYAAAKGCYPPKKRRKKNSIYICTIEKASGLINSLIETERFKEIGIIVIDELHLLGESGGRGATLEGILTKVMYVSENVHILGMSATIGNLNEIAQFLNADLYTQDFRPITINEYVMCESSIWLVDIKSEELLTDVKKINYRYTQGAAKLDPDKIGGLVMDVVPQHSCLIFCSSRKNCENVALLLIKVLFRSLKEHKVFEKHILLEALKTEEGLCPVLRKTIPFGVAYHHSGLTSEERKLLEDAFREGTLCVICCTSTLAAGINLPARRVILRSPYVGNQFLNLSRYKQMIGRAGRSGMGDIGESILICKNVELPKVKELLTSKLDDCVSTIHIEKDRGINNLILSSVLLSIATTRSELHKLIAATLLNIQQIRLNINVKQIADAAIIALLKCGVMKVKKGRMCNIIAPDTNITLSPQEMNDKKEKPAEKDGKIIIALTAETEFELCDLGRAAMKGSIDLQSAFILYQDLKNAQKHLILIDYLHLLYLVTPYDIVSQIKPIGSVYYDVVTNLSSTEMETARLLGINEATVDKLRSGILPKNVEARIIHRFYATLILYELWNFHAVYTVAEKYEVNRGILQNLLSSVSSFASSVVRFCEELNEFWAFKELLNTFSKKLYYCCPAQLELLMELPSVKIGRARQLYNAGYTTLQAVAKADPKDLQEKIRYLHKKTAAQIIASANLLIMEKVENLKDEAEDVLDGIDIHQLKTYQILDNEY